MFKDISIPRLLISFGITLVCVFIVAIGVYAAMIMFFQAPEVPTHAEVILHDPSSSEPVQIETVMPDGTVIISYEEEDDTPVVTVIMPRKRDFFTFLIFAIDHGNNVDALMVASFDTNSGEVNLISMPRDTRILSDRRLSKLVSGYSAGRIGGGGHEGGVAQVMADVQSLIGFLPDFYVSVDFAGFERLIDAVGGVEVTVPFNMQYTDPTQNLFISINAGTQTLSGRRALHFARYRYGDPGFRSVTDYARMEHQQMIISSVANDLLSPRMILQIPNLINIYSEHVNTNLTITEKLWFAARVSRIDGGINMYTLPIAGTSGAPMWYELPDLNGILELVNETVNPFLREITAEMVRINP